MENLELISAEVRELRDKLTTARTALAEMNHWYDKTCREAIESDETALVAATMKFQILAVEAKIHGLELVIREKAAVQ